MVIGPEPEGDRSSSTGPPPLWQYTARKNSDRLFIPQWQRSPDGRREGSQPVPGLRLVLSILSPAAS